MTDKELLELAAKAAGFTNLIYCPAWKCMAEFDIDKQGGVTSNGIHIGIHLRTIATHCGWR